MTEDSQPTSHPAWRPWRRRAPIGAPKVIPSPELTTPEPNFVDLSGIDLSPLEPSPVELIQAEPTLDHPVPPPKKCPRPLIWAQSTGHWVRQRPWLALPLLAVFPAIGWTMERARPPSAPVVIGGGRPIGNAATAAMPLQIPLLPNPPVAAPPKLPTGLPTAAPSATPKPLTPVDPNQLTPAQKEMNRKAKLALGATSHLVDALVEIQVAIATKAGVLAVGGSTPVEVQDDKGKTLYQLAAGEIYTAAADGAGIAIGNQSLPVSIWLSPTPGGLFYLGNRPYRGKLLLVNQGGKLWAINYVNLRQYLHSVVASEVSPSWSPEALKAQAVAARSYALTYYFKRANPLYHLGNDEYYQVYSGIEREAASTNQAVDDTSGQYVSYKGGIVESLYAASDDIVAEAFQGRGMSQLGALSLANQGYQYSQILAKYYPGTAVGAIAADGE